MPRKNPPQSPLYVRLPKTEGDKLRWDVISKHAMVNPKEC